jgi:apolipoprotein D and lipocalin family protein
MRKLNFAKSIVPVLFSCGAAGMALTGCQNLSKSQVANTELKAISKKVDLERFMGDWYVIAHIPVFVEKDAYNAVENYQLAADGSIPTTFTFNKGSFDGPLKTMHPKGFVKNKETNAEWRMQFIWPIKAAYLITYLSDDYQTTIIGVPNRKYAWIMARTKTLPAERYAALVKELERQGYDLTKLRKVPQEGS